MSISPTNAASSSNNILNNPTIKAATSENNIDIIKEAEKDSKEVTAVCNVNSNSELTLENFEKILEKEYKKPFNRIEANIKEKHFSIILCNMSDEEKAAKLNFILNKFQINQNLIKIFFESFKDKEKAKACADSIDLNTLKDLSFDVQKEIIKHMSVPGTQKLFNECEDKVYAFYHKHQDIIDKVYKNSLSEEERQTLIDSLTEDEKSVIKQYCELVQIGINITQGVTGNENLSEEEKEEFITQANNFFKELPSYNLFLEEMAKFISNNPDDLNIDKKKLTEILDKLSENKFSDKVQKLAEKSAIDKDTGMLKTADKETIYLSKERIQEIKQNITDISNPEPIVVEAENSKSETNNTSDTGTISYKTITGDDGSDIIKDIFTGKVKVSEYLEQVAIKQYKLMNTAVQGNILLNATGEFFNDLVQTLETSTFEHLLSIGWKGRSYAATQQVKDEVEKRQDDVA